MTNDASPRSQWATLTLQLESGPIERTELADRADRLDEVGALLAMDPDVDGVQTLHPKFEPVERPGLLVYTRPDALARVEALVRELLDAHGLAASVTPEVREDTQWQDLWKQFYRPLTFGAGMLLVRPSWIARREHDPALEIVLDPGRAFGTGLHPTTQLCLQRLCTLRNQGLAPSSLLDLGCGSGILGLSGARLFPSVQRVVSVDHDPEATETAQENAEANDLTDRLDIRTGDIETLGTRRFDVIVANIRPSVLIPLAGRLLDHISPGGDLVLSGILPEEADAVAAAYVSAGWQPRQARREHDGWAALDWTWG